MDSGGDSRAVSEGYSWRVQVRSASHLDYWLKDCFEGLDISHEEDGSSTLIGKLQDIPAVYGLILQLRDMKITLLSLQVERVPYQKTGSHN